MADAPDARRNVAHDDHGEVVLLPCPGCGADLFDVGQPSLVVPDGVDGAELAVAAKECQVCGEVTAL